MYYYKGYECDYPYYITIISYCLQIHMHACVCLNVCLPACGCVSLYVCVCLHVYVCLPECVSACVWVCQPV